MLLLRWWGRWRGSIKEREISSASRIYHPDNEPTVVDDAVAHNRDVAGTDVEQQQVVEEQHVLAMPQQAGGRLADHNNLGTGNSHN